MKKIANLKKAGLLGVTALTAISASAQNSTEPTVHHGVVISKALNIAMVRDYETGSIVSVSCDAKANLKMGDNVNYLFDENLVVGVLVNEKGTSVNLGFYHS